jgi:molybdate transport system substrate-binding protein
MTRKILTLLSLAFLLACSAPRERATLTIATAANMQFAMEALTAAFTASSGIACEPVISSSGKLTAQIRAGAPYGVLVSADLKYPQALFDEGLATAAPRVYAYGTLVLWTQLPGQAPTIDWLLTDSVRHLAIANPLTAPYGVAALEVLDYYQLRPALAGKLVYGESIAQTNQFVRSGAAEAGFTAMSIVRAPGMRGQGRWLEIDPRLYTPIAQGVVVVRGAQAREAQAQQFVDFLFSAAAQDILQNFGYRVAE